ncbi:MAG: TonB-dependent receptor [Tannerellaceae bacterium]|nr:TonB-dependent receptor [Tannerellaceae bacterium]
MKKLHEIFVIFNRHLLRIMNVTVLSLIVCITTVFAAGEDHSPNIKIPLSKNSVFIIQDPIKDNIQQQYSRVSGVVLDNLGEPVIGANIVQKETLNGTITNIDGEFSLSVPGDAIIQVSYIGYFTQEIAVNNQTQLTIRMREDVQGLEEVVVVGYGTQRKANLTGAVTQIAGDVLENRPITNISQGLQGAIPNLNVSVNSGAPGQSTSLNIRGTTSINEGSPLVLVDNVVMDPDLLNPEDVESITVLKDAASAAIYGARAAFGVVLITTKKGHVNEKPQITFSTNLNWQGPAKKIETINSMEFLTMKDIAYQNGGGSGHYYNQAIYDYAERYFNGTWSEPVFYDPDIDPNKYQYVGNTNWWDEIYKKNSFSQNYTIGINGGTTNTSYYMSLGFNESNGILKEADEYYKRFNVNLNVSTDIAKWLNVSGKVLYNYTKETHPAGGVSDANSSANAGISPYSGYLKNDISPLMPVYHPDGNFAGQGSYTNPVAIQKEGGNTTPKQNDIWLTGGLRLTPFEGFVFNTDYTFNIYGRGEKTHVRNFYDYTAVAGTEQYYPWTNPNSVVMSNDEDYYTAFNMFAEYTKSFIQKHNFKVMAGYNQEYKHDKYFYVGRQELIDNNNPALNMATGETTRGASETHWSINGFFFRLNYDYMQKYLLEVNGRYDGSSRFPKDDRYAFFPSVSAGWRISEELFWGSIKEWWSDMKIRLSYGSLGNQAVSNLGNFPYLPSYSINTAMSYMIGGTTPVSVSPPGLVSGSFTWETVNQIDIGFDATLLNNRLGIDFDWYRRDTKDMLTGGQDLPAVLGTSVPNENAANLKTIGFEISVNWMDHLSNGLSYWIKGVLADYQSTITKYVNDTGSIFTSDGSNQYYKGYKVGQIWGYRSNGLFQSDEEVASSPSQSALYSGEWAAGDVKYVDLNGDGVINYGNNTLDNLGDRTIIGNSTPRFTFGITAGFEYKNFDFEMFWQGVGKRDYMFESSSVHFWGFTSEWDAPVKAALDYWTPENTDAYFPRPNWNNSGDRVSSDRYIQNAAYARLKNLTVGYTFPKNIMNKYNIGKLRVYFACENLLTITKMIDSFDPETLNNMTYPINRKYSIGFNLIF